MGKQDRLNQIRNFERLLEKQTGKAVRPYRADGYVNVLNKYGTEKDQTEHYRYQPEPVIPDDFLVQYYESNGLFAKIIDAPAEEAIKHGFHLDQKDQKIEDFYVNALDELDWDETAMTALKWTRLFGGCIVVMMINDGRGVDEPLDWANIKSIDDLRIYDRSVIQEDTSGMFNYRPDDPFRTRSSRLGMPEYYDVYSRYGSFRVHDSRCLVFQNGTLPENTTNSIYQMWGLPEYVRINKAIRDAEVAHGSAIKMLDRSIQAVYKMKDLSAELSTEEGEDRVLRRLQTIDMARGMLNSITIDAEGEDYDFRTFQFTGVSEVVDTACNYLSALTNIPQTVLFGRSPAGMNATGTSDLENWYNYVDRIRTRVVKKNLRYLLSIIFQAGVACGEIDEVPEINIAFHPLWSLSESEQAAVDQQRAAVQQTRAATAIAYIDAQVIDPTEVRRKLADSEEFDIENMLDEYESEEDLFANMPQQQPAEGEMPEGGEMGGMMPEGMEAPEEGMLNPQMQEAQGEEQQGENLQPGVSVERHNNDPGEEGNAPMAAPAATKLPEDMNEEEKEKAAKKDGRMDGSNFKTPITYRSFGKAYSNTNNNAAQITPQSHTIARKDGINNSFHSKPINGSVGILVVVEGCILSGVRKTGFNPGLVCGPGGHVEDGESFEEAAIRETQEEFGITPLNLMPIGYGPWEPDTGLKPMVFLSTEYEGEIRNTDGEMGDLRFRTLHELREMEKALFQPFKSGIELLMTVIGGPDDHFDGGPGFGSSKKDGRADGILTPSELAAAFQSVSPKKEATREQCHPLHDAFEQLEQTDLEYIADAFSVSTEALLSGTEEELREIYELICDDEWNQDIGNSNSGNHGHKGRPGQRGGSAKGSYSASDFKNGSGDFELTGDVSDMYLTDTARAKIESATKQVRTANDLKNYLSDKGIEMVVDYKPLQNNMDREIESVKQQADYVIAAIEQYEDLGGLSSLKAIHFYDTELDPQAQYAYRASGEDEVEDEGHLYISDRADGFQIMHEFAHAYADSSKPEGMDVVEWSAELNKTAGLSDSQGAYLGSDPSAREAERFADAVGSALCYGEGPVKRLTFLADVASAINGSDDEENEDGGPGSGNFGHEGRPGEVGGSASGESSGSESASGKASSTETEKQKAYKAKLKSEKEELLQDSQAQQALAMVDAGYLSYDEGVAAMKSKTASERVEEYYSIMEQNGDPTSEKPLSDNQSNINSDVDSGKYSSYGEARRGYIKEKTGCSDEESKEMAGALDTWVGNNWDRADTKQIDKFVESDHTYDGEIYRGLHFIEGRDETTFDEFMETIEVGGTISASGSGHNASWSSREEDASQFSHRGDQYDDSVIIHCVQNRTSSPISYLNMQGEAEVVSHSRARWTVLNVQTYEKRNGGRHAEITVVETGEYASESNGDGIMNKDSESKQEKPEKTAAENKPMSMFDRWDASSKDFKAYPRKKENQAEK